MTRKTLTCVAVCSMVLSLADADTLRYRSSGPWQDLDNGSNGWISPDAPDSTDTVRANWGGATITLNFETTVNQFQAGVDESGTFHILAGGVLNTAAGNNKIGNNGSCTGTMIIDAGGEVNSTGWLMIAGNSTVSGVADVSGLLNSASHLWMATGAGSTATLDINSGGTVGIGGMIGLGTVNAVDPSGGTATLNVNDGGLLILSNIHGAGTSVQPGSMLNLYGSGRIEMTGNYVGHFENQYIPNGTISGDGVAGAVVATYDEGANLTTVTVIPEPATLSLLGIFGAAILFRRRMFS